MKELKYPLGKHEDYKDTKGRWKTLSLFWETRGASANNIIPNLTLSEQGREIDGVFYPSLKEEYVKWGNPIEYDFVINCLGTSMRHWNKLLNNAKIRAYIDEAREELAMKLQAQGIKKQLELCNDGNYSSAKLLLEKGWLTKDDLKKDGKNRKEVGSSGDNDLANFLERVK